MKNRLTIPLLAGLGIAGLTGLALTSLAQPRPLDIPQLNTDLAINSISNLRVGSMSEDGTETTLVMEYTYNGNNGPTALLVPVIDSRRQKGVSGWFGTDQVTVPKGRGPVSFKVKFFNDEPGVPPTITTDRIQIWILTQSGTSRIGGSTELKTIKWGREGLTPKPSAITPAPETAAREVAQLAAEAESRAREQARRAAEAEAQARKEAEEREAIRRKADAEAKAAAQAREDAKREALRQAEERKRLEAKAAMEAKERDEAARKAEAEARRLLEEQRKAEERARAQAEARERERLQAEAREREKERQKADEESARLAAEKLKADEKAALEAKEREQARMLAEEQARKQEEEARVAEARAQAAEAARLEAEQRAAVEAKNRAAAEARAAEAAALKAEEEASAQAAATAAPPPAATSLRTKITNVDVVNRSLDRSQMTIGVEFDLKDKFATPPYMGIEVQHSAKQGVSQHFSCDAKEVGRQKFLLLNVRFEPQGTPPPHTMLTDRLLVYFTDESQAQRSPLHPATMLLVWRAPDHTGNGAATPAALEKQVELGDFRQRSPQSGYARVNYQIPSGEARLRVRLKNSAVAGSESWFITEPVTVKGTGLELIPVSLLDQAGVPAGTVKVDTIEVELLNAEGTVIGRDEKATDISWSKGG